MTTIRPVSLSEDDIPGASLNGRKPSILKTDELRFWLKCRGDPAKGLKTKSSTCEKVRIRIIFVHNALHIFDLKKMNEKKKIHQDNPTTKS